MNTVHFKEHRVVEKEERSSYLSRFWCLDNMGHHIESRSVFIEFVKKIYTFLNQIQPGFIQE